MVKREQVYLYEEKIISNIPQEVLIQKSDLKLDFKYKKPKLKLEYNQNECPTKWQAKCRLKLKELLGIKQELADRKITIYHKIAIKEGVVYSLLMEVEEGVTIPAYLCVPDVILLVEPVIAIQGHGDVRGVLGLIDDYHHGFGAEMFNKGRVVLIPELRGFGNLYDLASTSTKRRLDYANWGHHMAYSLVTDGFMKGHTLMGDTVEDLMAWAKYACEFTKSSTYMSAGISYGGDLALILGALDENVVKTFASGTLGSMDVIFEKCYNMPSHCIPNILKYMDRKEIASCIAPRDLYVHYGEFDKPSADNYSAAFNETVIPTFENVERFYERLDSKRNIQLFISKGLGHEMDNNILIKCLNKG